MERLALHHRMGILALSLVAPRLVALKLLRPLPAFGAGGEPDLPANAERVSFPSRSGQYLRGWWLKPAQVPVSDACVVLAHGWTGYALRMQPLAAPLLAAGYQVLIYDARSHGDSDRYDYCSMMQFAEDVGAAAAFASRRVDRIALVGHSLGAAGSLVAAADGAPAQAVVALAPPAHPVRGIVDLLQKLGVPGELVCRRVMPYVLTMLGRPSETFTPELRLKDIACPVMIVHGTADEVVPVSHFHALHRTAGERVQTHELSGVNHDLIRGVPEVEALILPFLRQHMPA